MSELFNSGQRPAIDSGLSVSRVGSAAQYKCIKQTSKALKIELASYNELQAFAKFGSDVDEVTKKTLKHGDILMEVLKQNQYSPMTFVQQTIEIFTAQNNFLDDLEVSEVRSFLDKIWLSLNKNHQDILLEIEDKKALSDELIAKMKVVIKDIKESLK